MFILVNVRDYSYKVFDLVLYDRKICVIYVLYTQICH